MTNKVILKYEDNFFKVCINDKMVAVSSDMDIIIEKFKQVFKDNTAVSKNVSWEDIFERVSTFNNEDLEINNDYKTVSYKNMKYFYASNKIFYIANDTMTPLLGGYELFHFILELVSSNFSDYEAILKFCKKMMEHEINYRTFDSTIVVSSPGFNYGFVEYNFMTNKISKGTAISVGTFEEYTDYVIENL